MNDEVKNTRDRIRETLELIASKEDQLTYQEGVPYVKVSGEIFNQWEDWYFPGEPDFAAAFTPDELAALHEFNATFEKIADATPQILPPIQEFVETSEWQEYSDAAITALQAFTKD